MTELFYSLDFQDTIALFKNLRGLNHSLTNRLIIIGFYKVKNNIFEL